MLMHWLILVACRSGGLMGLSKCNSNGPIRLLESTYIYNKYIYREFQFTSLVCALSLL